MKMGNTVIVFQLVLYSNWIFFVIGLECPSCLHVATGNATPATIRDLLNNNSYFKAFSNPECAMDTDIDGHQNQVQMKSCDEVPGDIVLCGHFSGQFTMTMPVYSKVPLIFTHRGCYNFTKAEMPQIGCMNRTNEAVDIKVMNQTVADVAKHSSFLTGVTVESVIGELCLYDDTTTTVTPKNSAKALFKKDVLIEFIFFLVYWYTFLS